jgi:hypothetical protein
MKKININLKDVCNYEINVLHNNDIFVDMTKELINIDLNNWKKTKWYNYYKTFNPKNLDDIYKINSKTLKKLPAETIFEPWTHGKPVPLDGVWGEAARRAGMYGIKDDDFIYKQIKQTKELINSIKSKGYIESDNVKNNVVTEILKYKEKKKYLIISGHHRTNVLKALNYKNINVFLNNNIFLKPKNLINNKRYSGKKSYKSVIDYDNAENWPAVKSGFISIEEAQKMFLSYFNS